jgi:hypothetical protein
MIDRKVDEERSCREGRSIAAVVEAAAPNENWRPSGETNAYFTAPWTSDS